MSIAKIILIVVLIAVCVVALGATGWVAAYYFYRPQYLKSTKTFDISQTPMTEEITVMSYNVRCLSFSKDCGKESWFYRADLVTEMIAQNTPDIIGLQEATTSHIEYLSAHLKGYNAHITYRETKKRKESTSIFYRADRFELLDEGHFWLSETPDVMSKYAGAGNYRDANYLVLRDKFTGKEFVYYNTHLDARSGEARAFGMRVITEHMKKFDGYNIVFTGDMNDYDTSEMYTVATSFGFKDSMLIADLAYSGDGRTWTDYGKSDDFRRIDYCFLKGNFKVYSYKIDDRLINGAYPSDHTPVVVKLKIN